MNVGKIYNDKELTIKVDNQIDTVTAPDFENEINDEMGKFDSLILDFEKLEYISSAGLRVLLGAQKKMQKIGSMKVINVCVGVMEVFEMTGFSDILTIE